MSRKSNTIVHLLPTLPRGRHVANGVFPPEQDNDKTNVEPVHSYEAFHTRSDKPGVKGIIGMHRFNICRVVLSLSCSGVPRGRHVAKGTV